MLQLATPVTISKIELSFMDTLYLTKSQIKSRQKAYRCSAADDEILQLVNLDIGNGVNESSLSYQATIMLPM